MYVRRMWKTTECTSLFLHIPGNKILTHACGAIRSRTMTDIGALLGAGIQRTWYPHRPATISRYASGLYHHTSPSFSEPFLSRLPPPPLRIYLYHDLLSNARHSHIRHNYLRFMAFYPKLLFSFPSRQHSWATVCILDNRLVLKDHEQLANKRSENVQGTWDNCTTDRDGTGLIVLEGSTARS